MGVSCRMYNVFFVFLLGGVCIDEKGEDDSEPADSFDLQDPSRPGKIQCYDPSTMQFLGEMPAMTPEEVFSFSLNRTLFSLFSLYMCTKGCGDYQDCS